MNTNVIEYGAVPDSSKICTDAFQAAIKACSESGGGYVFVPAGRYESGTIELLSNVFLQLSPGSELLGSPSIEDYKFPRRGCAWSKNIDTLFGKTTISMCRAFILGDNAENCGILGEGIIDGRRSFGHGYNEEKGRPFLVVFSECKGVKIKDVTLKNPGMFAIYNLNNRDVMIDSVKIYSSDSINGDGIDFDGSCNVTITNCILDTSDDAIGLKTLTPDEPCENYVILNCIIRSKWAAIRLGPETAGDMRSITITDCVFNECNDGIKLQLCDNSCMEDLIFTNLNMMNVARPIFITSSIFPMSRYSHSVRPRPGILRRIFIKSILAKMKQKGSGEIFSGNYICGLPESTVEDIMLCDVHITTPGGGDKVQANRTNHAELLDYSEFYPDIMQNMGDYPSAGLYIKNASSIKLYNCTFDSMTHDERFMIAAENVDHLKLYSCESTNNNGLLRYYHCDGLKLLDCAGQVRQLENEQAADWDRFRELSLKTEDAFRRNANIIDEILDCDIAGEYDAGCSQILYDHTGGTVYFYIPRFKGNLDVFVNDRLAAMWHIPEVYTFCTSLGVDITQYLQTGSNIIRVKAAVNTVILSRLQLRKMYCI